MIKQIAYEVFGKRKRKKKKKRKKKIIHVVVKTIILVSLEAEYVH
jgi:hypothetical protein